MEADRLFEDADDPRETYAQIFGYAGCIVQAAPYRHETTKILYVFTFELGDRKGDVMECHEDSSSVRDQMELAGGCRSERCAARATEAPIAMSRRPGITRPGCQPQLSHVPSNSPLPKPAEIPPRY